MHTFKDYRAGKLRDKAFRALYERECHVCRVTVRIFETLEDEGISLAEVATALGVAEKDLQALKDADRCDPGLVVRLCRHLQLDPPEACPRMSGLPAAAD